jgi:hypothetical protein
MLDNDTHLLQAWLQCTYNLFLTSFGMSWMVATTIIMNRCSMQPYVFVRLFGVDSSLIKDGSMRERAVLDLRNASLLAQTVWTLKQHDGDGGMELGSACRFSA